MIRGIIFDCDGVIIDSEPLFEEAFVLQMKEYDIEADSSKLADSTGVTARQFCTNLLEAYPEINKSVDELLIDYDKSVDAILMNDNLKEMAGFSDFVKKQYDKGVALGVASSSPAYYVKHKLELFGVAEMFSVVVSGDDVTHSKPDPQIFNIAAERMKLPKDELLIIEDSVNGIRAAKAAGIKVVGFKGSIISQDTSEADEEAYSFDDIQV